jgi:glucokinase
VIGVDIGGTKIAAAVVDPSYPANAVDTLQVPTEASHGGPHILSQTEKVIAALLEKYPDVSAIGVSTTGEVDASGAIQYAADFMPGYTGQPLKSDLEARFGLPVEVENDGQAAALGEAAKAAGSCWQLQSAPESAADSSSMASCTREPRAPGCHWDISP